MNARAVRHNQVSEGVREDIADKEDLKRMRGTDAEGTRNGVARAVGTRDRNGKRVADDQISLIVNKQARA